MFGIDDTTAVAVMPTPEAAGTPGFFTEGNPALGQAATYVRASFLNALQQELLNVLAGAGITPSKTAYDQLLSGLRSNALVTGNATGAANTYAVAYAPAITALVDGMILWLKASATNTGASTLNINAVGAKPLVGGAHNALQGGEIIANGRCLVVWNATLNSFVLIECTGAALQVAPGSASGHAVQLSQVGQHFAVITASGSFTVPAGVYSLDAEAWGGGGGGGGVGSAGNGSAGGGGGGGYARGILAVVPGQVITATVGAAGAPGGAGGAGGAGGTTTFGGLSATGGAGGSANGVGTGGGGGTGTGGAINCLGGSGSGGLGAGNGPGGPGGGAPFGGPGGGSAVGIAGVGAIPGGGGGGTGSSVAQTGTAGARGQINIRY